MRREKIQKIYAKLILKKGCYEKGDLNYILVNWDEDDIEFIRKHGNKLEDIDDVLKALLAPNIKEVARLKINDSYIRL